MRVPSLVDADPGPPCASGPTVTALLHERIAACCLAAAALLLSASCSDSGTTESPCEPRLELCDGIDNDCDGAIDENLDCCSAEMTSVTGRFCIDRWEASRADATSISEGDAEGAATSGPGVLPWKTGGTAAGYEVASAACDAAGKRLCTPTEWSMACAGLPRATYSYGDVYDPVACNGIDAHCDDPVPGCGAIDRANGIDHYRVEPTGAFPQCTNDYGVYDITGNLWEFVTASGAALTVRGGAYNCGDSAFLHRCAYVSPAAMRTEVGFRCCADPAPQH